MKMIKFRWNVTEICSHEFNKKWGSIGSGNALAPNRRHANTWTNVDPVHWREYAALGGDELKDLITIKPCLFESWKLFAPVKLPLLPGLPFTNIV